MFATRGSASWPRAFAAPFLLVALVVELLFKPAPDAPLVGTLLAGLFAAAFLIGFGKDLASRVKKIGPVEIQDVQEAVRELDAISTEVVKELQGPFGPSVKFERTDLTAAQRFFYSEGDKIVTHLKLSGSEPAAGAQRESHWELLFIVGRTAYSQLEWWKAIRWLEHLEARSGGAYRGAEVRAYLAYAILFAAMTEKDEERRTQGLRKAATRFARIAERGEMDYQAYFWQAYVLDELGQWYEAVRSNDEALLRRPLMAPARYNLSISLLKLGKVNNAYWQLKNIQPTDDEIELVAEGAAGDAEMKRLVEAVSDPAAKLRIQNELERLGSLR